jgi:hypothetical protein
VTKRGSHGDRPSAATYRSISSDFRKIVFGRVSTERKSLAQQGMGSVA